MQYEKSINQTEEKKPSELLVYQPTDIPGTKYRII